MYGRNVDNRELTFEASGGLIKSSLVLQDRKTSGYWPIMRGDAVAGELKGTRLKELIGFDTLWYNWSLNNQGTHLLK